MDISTLAVALGYAKKQVEQAKREGFRVQIEQDRSILETTGEEKIFYFLPKNPQKAKDGYDEFVYANNNWEQVGVTDIDLSAYALKSEIPTKVSQLQNDSRYLTQHQDISGKADKATTLAGYGITDAYTKSEVDAAVGSKTISSAAVNNNGTITFTLSDSSAITTTGTSVIGPQGPAGANGQDGADGVSPTATVTQTASGATITVTDANGTTTANIANGQDYNLTAQDKSDIAALVLAQLPTTQGVQYGN